MILTEVGRGGVIASVESGCDVKIRVVDVGRPVWQVLILRCHITSIGCLPIYQHHQRQDLRTDLRSSALGVSGKETRPRES